jgi:outer membrane lipoprotein-sorting protein
VIPRLFALAALLAALARPMATLRAQGTTGASTTPSAATDSLLDRAARAMASARTLRSAFDQTLTNPDTRTVKTSHGEFTQQGASKFAFRFSDPAGDAIISDGSAIWVYLPSSARGQALKLPIAQGAQLDILAQLLTRPRETYKVAESPGEEMASRPVAVVVLTPKVPNAAFTRATLWLDREDAVVRQLEAVELSGLVRRIRFRDIRTDVELPKDALTFVVPPNVKVLDASSLLGGMKPPKPPPR